MKIKVIGIGGCGCNIVDNICRGNVEDISFTLVNREGLSSYTSTAEKICISNREKNLDESLRQLLTDNPQTIIIAAGMGGKYSAQVAATLCRLHKTIADQHVQSIVFAVTPFNFESRDKKAAEDIALVSEQATRVITFDNNNLLQHRDRPMAEVFRMVDEEVRSIIKEEKQKKE